MKKNKKRKKFSTFQPEQLRFKCELSMLF